MEEVKEVLMEDRVLMEGKEPKALMEGKEVKALMEIKEVKDLMEDKALMVVVVLMVKVGKEDKT